MTALADTRAIHTRASHTRCWVAFYTWPDNGPSRSAPFQSNPVFGTLIRASTMKEMGSASGTFSLTFKTAQGAPPIAAVWAEPEGVWCRIWLEVEGQRMETMLGLVDAVSSSTQRQGRGQRSVTYTITGRDFGKVLETTETFVNLHGHQQQGFPNVAEITKAALRGIANHPAGFIRTILDIWLKPAGFSGGQWELPQGVGGLFAYDLIKRQIQAMTLRDNGDCLAPALFQVDQSGGKLWDTMQEYSNGVLNEMWVDLATPANPQPGAFESLAPTLYMREKPFPTFDATNQRAKTEKWESLRTWDLGPGDIQQRQIAKGGAAARYNYWLLRLQGLGTEGFDVAELLQTGRPGLQPGYPGNIPIFSARSIRRHGLRRYDASTRFIPYYTQKENNSNQQYLDIVGAWLQKIHDWYAPAPLQLSGSLRLSRLAPEIRVGTRVRETTQGGDRQVYYVEGVQHEWNYPEAGVTTLTVTRGTLDGAGLSGLDGLGLVPSTVAVIANIAAVSEFSSEATFSATGQLRYVYGQYTGPEAEPAPITAVVEEGALTEGQSLIDDPTFVTDAAGNALDLPSDAELPDGANPTTEQLDPAMNPTLDDSIETIETPETPAQDGLSQRQLERGDPINIPETDDDPLAGL